MNRVTKAKRKPRERDAQAFLAMVRRMLRSAAKRVGEADEHELKELAELHAEVELAIATAVQLQRDHGKSWAAIGSALGTSRQGAQQRFERRRTA